VAKPKETVARRRLQLTQVFLAFQAAPVPRQQLMQPWISPSTPKMTLKIALTR
jgi:hypothetical protein